jgi:mono/diheme cytochrome c family protein
MMAPLGVARVICSVSIALLAACSASKAAPSDDGEQTFANICSRCHGQAGTGGLPLTPGGPKPRDFTDPVWQASKSDAELELTVAEGKLPMPSFKALLSPQQIHAVVGKVRRFRKGGQ